jgi:uncharacterized protein YdhG (YjbR/CyaY superfamily)
MTAAGDVHRYILAAPAPTRVVLRKVREAILEAAPDAVEGISYGLPFYSYRGEAGIEGRLCYFGLKRAGLGFYLRPKDLEPHTKLIAKYSRSKSALLFPLDEPIPYPLIKRLVRGAVRRHLNGKGNAARRGTPLRKRPPNR